MFSWHVLRKLQGRNAVFIKCLKQNEAKSTAFTDFVAVMFFTQQGFHLQ